MPALSRTLNADEQRTADAAIVLFRAFVGGVAAAKLRPDRMTPAEAKAWKDHAIKTFEQSLKEILE